MPGINNEERINQIRDWEDDVEISEVTVEQLSQKENFLYNNLSRQKINPKVKTSTIGRQ